MNHLKILLEDITTHWKKATQESFTNHPVAIKFRIDLSEIVKDIITDKYPTFKVKSSVGAGNWASVPWLSILDPDITETTQDGIYPVYLFKADGTGFYLSLNQGTTNPEKTYGKTKAIELLHHRRDKLLKKINGLSQWGIKDIELNSSTDLGRSYEKSNIIAKYYESASIPEDHQLKKDLFDILKFYEKAKEIYMEEAIVKEKINKYPVGFLRLSKPFILLAGISGTGKSRFVREQSSSKENFCSISVRPDWHEPSDLLGYVSRLTGTIEYNPTDALSFIVQAWVNAWDHSNTTENALAIVDPSLMEPFWLCLDEMNLAPVEQYFADYLSVIESRKWDAGNYTCDPLLKASEFKCLEEAELKKLRKQLGVEDSQYDNMWQYFSTIGIPVPPNLIVAGTVNMDETTHGFSRKVIDRALTIDFGKFFPNDFDHYLKQEVKPKAFTFPILSEVSVDDLANITADPEGEKTIQFCKDLNEKLKDSSFELAFRALNELLISLVCIKPENEVALQAVWDDFLMTKVLPRIEGDRDKLSVIGSEETILSQLSTLLTTNFTAIQAGRPDFFREKMDGTSITIPCRSNEKIRWMEKRLETNGFTAFWP